MQSHPGAYCPSPVKSHSILGMGEGDTFTGKCMPPLYKEICALLLGKKWEGRELFLQLLSLNCNYRKVIPCQSGLF